MPSPPQIDLGEVERRLADRVEQAIERAAGSYHNAHDNWWDDSVCNDVTPDNSATWIQYIRARAVEGDVPAMLAWIREARELLEPLAVAGGTGDCMCAGNPEFPCRMCRAHALLSRLKCE